MHWVFQSIVEFCPKRYSWAVNNAWSWSAAFSRPSAAGRKLEAGFACIYGIFPALPAASSVEPMN
jgi:hypothetical protein